jgi:superfamily II DNA or RNA helicase
MASLGDFINSGGGAENSEDEKEPVPSPKLVEFDYLPDGEDGTISITSSGAYIRFKYLQIDPDLDEKEAHRARMKLVKRLENYFTLKTMQIIGAMKQSKRCKVNRKREWITVPRFGVFEVLTKKFGLRGFTAKSHIKPGEPPKTPFVWQGQLFPNQVVTRDYIRAEAFSDAHVARGSAGAILNMPAGQGKTYVASSFIGDFQRKTAIIVHSTSMITQWTLALQACYGNDVSVGYYYGKKKVDGDIVIIVINSVLTDEFTFKTEAVRKAPKLTLAPLDYFNRFGFVIYDEAHLYANKNSGKAFSLAQAPYTLGLSATPNENANGFDRIVWWGVGPVVEATKIPGFDHEEVSFSCTLHRVNYYGGPKYTRHIKNAKTDMTSVTETIGMICEDPERTAVVLDSIMECLGHGCDVFVFADRRDYCEMLREGLIARDVVSEIMTDDTAYARIVGGTREADFKQAEELAKVIFTTYQYMGTGKSIVRMNGLVMASPRKSKMEQYVKRVFRLGSDTSVRRHVYDIVDVRTPLKNQFYVRNKFYKAQAFDVEQTSAGPCIPVKGKGRKKKKTPVKRSPSPTEAEVVEPLTDEAQALLDRLRG